MKKGRENKSTGVTYGNFDDLYGEISRDWQAKAKALQARRWQNLSDKGIVPPDSSLHRAG